MSSDIRGVSLWQYTPNDLLKFWADHTAEIEPELFDWFETFDQGSVYFDMGASSGVFAAYAALKTGVKVYAFEPEAQNHAIADTNAFLNKQENPAIDLNIFNMAIGNETKTEKLYIRRYRAGEHNKIVGVAELRDSGEAFEPEHIQAAICVSLDDLVSVFKLPAPRYLKIDVDGAELDVLAGGHKTLSSGQVKEIFIEVYDPDNSSGGLEIMRMLNYYGFKEISRHPVKHMRGGVYPDLFNIIFQHEG